MEQIKIGELRTNDMEQVKKANIEYFDCTAKKRQTNTTLTEQAKADNFDEIIKTYFDQFDRPLFTTLYQATMQLTHLATHIHCNPHVLQPTYLAIHLCDLPKYKQNRLNMELGPTKLRFILVPLFLELN